MHYGGFTHQVFAEGITFDWRASALNVYRLYLDIPEG